MIPKKFSVLVTNEDIENGLPLIASKCAVALAIKRLIGKQADIFEFGSAVIDGNWYIHDGKDFIRSIGNGEECKPTIVNFEFYSEHIDVLYASIFNPEDVNV